MQGKINEAKKLIDDAASSYDNLVKIADDQRILSSAAGTYYLKGNIQKQLKQNPDESFRKAESIQRKLIAKSENVNTQGMLLKILASSGKTDKAIALAQRLAQADEKANNCGYAAAGYSLVLENLDDDDPRRTDLSGKAIELVRKLIGHGYQDFNALRETDLDFAALQDNADYLKMLDAQQAKQKTASTQ